MWRFYVLLGVVVATGIMNYLSFNHGADQGSRDWDHLDPDAQDKKTEK